MPNRLSRGQRLGLLLAATALLAAGPSLGQVALDSAQQKCVNGLNKGGARVEQGAERRELPLLAALPEGAGEQRRALLARRPAREVFKAAQKVFDQEPQLCGGISVPPFAYTSAFIVTTAGREQSLFFLEDLFGAEPNNAALLGTSDPDVGSASGGHQRATSWRRLLNPRTAPRRPI
jgi:hypothetical protein